MIKTTSISCFLSARLARSSQNLILKIALISISLITCAIVVTLLSTRKDRGPVLVEPSKLLHTSKVHRPKNITTAFPSQHPEFLLWLTRKFYRDLSEQWRDRIHMKLDTNDILQFYFSK